MKKKVRWFIKPGNDVTNESIHIWLARTSSHQDGFASQEIPVKGKKELLIEVPTYEIIKNLYQSARNTAFFKFKVFIMPPGAHNAGLWTLYQYQKKSSTKLLGSLNSQAKS